MDATSPVRSAAARTAALTALTLSFFAANSILARRALGPDLVDAATFTSVRIASGAVALALIAQAGRRRLRGGSWKAALALFVYAAAFSLAYRRIPAGPGALLLFAAVQATMIGWSVAHGARPTRLQWVGVAVAIAGLAYLTLPGAHAPDPAGAALMLASGVAWGAYSLAGRRAADALATTAANFARAVAITAVFSILLARGAHASAAGLALAAASGAIASGIGYSLWYTVVPALGATRAATVQLAVPVITPIAAAAVLGEAITSRVALAAVAILAGIGLALSRRAAGVRA
jgi:drug/metabolite transporter (DMT)-like permease